MIDDIDRAVIRRVLRGDKNAFETLVTKYEKQVYAIALRMTGNAEDAADMTQEAFFKAYRSLKSFRGDCAFSSWLYRIVSNVCLDFLRSKARHPEAPLSVEDEDGEELPTEIPDLSALPEDRLMAKLTREAVQRGLETLPPEQREVLILRELGGLSYDEIAETLSLEPNTVKTRLFRARKKLAAFLVEDGNIPDKYTSKNSGEVKKRD